MNIILNIPHANSVFPSVSEKEKWENKELLEAAIKDWTDWFTITFLSPSTAHIFLKCCTY